MRDIPIIFSAPMVRALLDGRKTQTRRILKSQPGAGAKGCYHRPDGLWIWTHLHRPNNGVGDGVGISEPFAIRFKVGDRLWARENFQLLSFGDYEVTRYQPCDVRYAATDTLADADREIRGYPWRPSIHMPRWASRLTLVVEQVRVERLQDITREDVYAEGAITDEWLQWREDAGNIGMPEGSSIEDERDVFARLWTSLHGADAWDANPWVVALTFAVHRRNIDAIPMQEAA
ncbi:hypothetical protein FBZ82_101155 [Azospirillum brasilense]|uniref:ASCH domain-containing protein n=1 Tax=Azospirillum brasilense TaxID=192 RepID=A0A560BNE6_AZOBR|nr:hypothetical protein [Azospirillum brasilense]TWA74140.1 hypothetical protein FBZ82_101155 [Azospirillum brasilense]